MGCILPVCGNWNCVCVVFLPQIAVVSYPCVGIETLTPNYSLFGFLFVSYPCVGIETLQPAVQIPCCFLLYLTRVWELKPAVREVIHVRYTCILPVCGNWNSCRIRSLFGRMFVSYPCVGIETLVYRGSPVLGSNCILLVCGNWNVTPVTATTDFSICILPVCGNWNCFELHGSVSFPCILPVCGNWNCTRHPFQELAERCILPVCGNWTPPYDSLISTLSIVSYPCVGIETVIIISYLTTTAFVSYPCVGIETDVLQESWKMLLSCILPVCGNWNIQYGLRECRLSLVSYPCVGIETDCFVANVPATPVVSYPCVGIETICYFACVEWA